MFRRGPRGRRALTVGAAMAAVALVAIALAVVANERWRWGHSRPVPFDHETALAWTATVIRSDYRMYDGPDVPRLLDYVRSRGLLLDKSKAQVEALLGVPDSDGDATPTRWAGRGEIYYVVGTVPRGIVAGPPSLTCHFGDDGVCDRVDVSGSY